MDREIIVKEWLDDKGLVHRREIGQELIRCKECIHEDDCEQEVLLSLMCYEVEDTVHITYCSYGERKNK